MPVTFVKGDFINQSKLVDGKRALACPVELTGVTTAGIANAVVKRWPKFAEFWAHHAKTAQVGDAPAFVEGDTTIYALAILRGKTRAKLSWLDRSLRLMLADAAEREITRIDVPRLWAGAGGLEGIRAKRVIEELSLNAPVALQVYEQFIRAAEGAGDAEEEEEEAEEEDADEDAAPKPKKKKAAAKKKTAAKKPAAPKKKTAAPKKKTVSKKK